MTNASKQTFESVLKRSRYSFGLYYYTENFLINKNKVKNFGISAGMSIPFNYGANNLSMSFSYGKRGSDALNGVSENVMKFNIGLSVGELWYRRLSED